VVGCRPRARSLPATGGQPLELAIPHLRILDYDETVAFYVGALGFEIEFEWRHEPGFPVYMGIRRPTLCAHLSGHEGSGPPGGGRGMTLSVDDADAWYEALRRKGIGCERPIETRPRAGANSRYATRSATPLVVSSGARA
jgi:catechol 2,3-dioxygenase-like lactoylglutathione lyase family enzyme